MTETLSLKFSLNVYEAITFSKSFPEFLSNNSLLVNRNNAITLKGSIDIPTWKIKI